MCYATQLERIDMVPYEEYFDEETMRLLNELDVEHDATDEILTMPEMKPQLENDDD